MPLARIRSFDPEAIAFLAAQLAQSGYTLQFVRPDETGLDEADLELTVVRRDLDEALRTAQVEAERLGVDVTVVPGVMPEVSPLPVDVVPEMAEPHAVAEIAEPIAEVADIPEPAPFPGPVEMPAASEAAASADKIGEQFAAEKFRWAQVAKESSEKTAHLLGRGLGTAVDGLEVISDSVERSFSGGKQSLADLRNSTTGRLNEWKTRFRTARALRREARQPLPSLAGANLTRNTGRRPKPLWLRERIYKSAAIAAVLATAAIIGWTLAGYAGPANPVGKGTGLSTVQEQVPFGPASANAPVLPATPVHLTQRISPKPSPVASTRASRPTAVRAHHDTDQEVVVRHFDRKSASEQAKAKNATREGVKIISEE